MDLMWIIYWLGFISSLNTLLHGMVTLSLVAGIMFVVFGGLAAHDKAIQKTTYIKITKIFVFLFFISGTLAVIVPSEKTAYMMVGANISQSVATTIANDPRTQQLTEKVFKAVNKQLDIYLEEDTK